MFCELLVFSGLFSLFKGIAILVVPSGIFPFVFAVSLAFAITFALVLGSVPSTSLAFGAVGSLQFG